METSRVWCWHWVTFKADQLGLSLKLRAERFTHSRYISWAGRGQILVSAGDAVLASGEPMPVDVSNGTILTGSVPEKLMNAIETAGNLELISKKIPILGTEFGVKTDPMPLSINITTKDYNCSVPTFRGSKSPEFSPIT